MPFTRVRMPVLGISTMLLLGGCAYGDLGGYGGLSIGVGSGGYYDDDYSPGGYYGDPRYGGYESYPRYGWYDGFYYPGQGAYVYDRVGRALAMRAQDRLYWLERRRALRDDRRADRADRRDERRDHRLERRGERETWTEDQRRQWAAQRAERLERRAERQDRRADRLTERQERAGRSLGQGLGNAAPSVDGRGRRGRRLGGQFERVQEP